MSRWDRTKTIIYKVDAPAVQMPPWARPPTEPAPETPYTEMIREMPARAATIESDVTVPFMQSLISGLFALVVSAGGCLTWNWDWTVPPLIAGGTFCVAWFYLLFDGRKLLRTIETAIGKDLDGDGYKGEPPEAPALTLNIEYRDSEGRARQRSFDLPAGVDLRVFRLFALAALKDWPISEREWTPEDKGFSVGRYRGLMTLLEKNGILAKEGKARNSKRQVTNYGRGVLEKLLDPYLDSKNVPTR